jgi:uncharacterized repeat protein (TIGR03803 family)
MRTSYLGSILSKIVLFTTLVAIGGASAPIVTENVLYAFGSTPDGALPVAGLVSDSKTGNLFGTTSGGGSKGFGIVFALTESSGHTKEDILYSFSGGSDGAVPKAGLIFNGSGMGNLYGTTSGGGKNKLGVVFELTKISNYTHEIVLHSFSGGKSDGAVPVAGLVIDSAGNLYGTTSGGGSKGFGVVFSLTGKGHLKETVLHTFSGGSDGAVPKAGLIFDGINNGNLFGTTSKGGSGFGVAFELTKNTSYKKEVVLHSFAGGTDGADPEAGLAFGPIKAKVKGLFGTTAGGGKGFGVVFKLTGRGHTTETVLYRFKGGPDGGVPLAGLIFTPLNADEPAGDGLTPPKGPGGCTYACGTTVNGGHLGCNHPNGCGVVFNLVK